MRDHNAVFLILVVGAGALLGILVSRRLITTRDVANLLLGVFFGYLLAKYVLPRVYVCQLPTANVPSHKCLLYDGPFVQRVSAGGDARAGSPRSHSLDPVPGVSAHAQSTEHT